MKLQIYREPCSFSKLLSGRKFVKSLLVVEGTCTLTLEVTSKANDPDYPEESFDLLFIARQTPARPMLKIERAISEIMMELAE
jgi:hypothetical protein